MKNTDEQNFDRHSKLLADHIISFDRKPVVVAFADLIGFAPWYMRAANSPEDRNKFMENLYRKMSYMAELGYYVKTVGDGAMFVKEMGPGHNCDLVIKTLHDLNCLYTYVRYLISIAVFPRPSGFRIRMASGNVTKIVTSFCQLECKLKNDYVGYPVNLASRLLRVDKYEQPFICHESVKDIIGDKKIIGTGIHFEKIQVKDHRVDGIDPQDFKNLWAVSFKEKNK